LFHLFIHVSPVPRKSENREIEKEKKNPKESPLKDDLEEVKFKDEIQLKTERRCSQKQKRNSVENKNEIHSKKKNESEAKLILKKNRNKNQLERR
jgi:hypothetical protein